jgi:hypothetical protein
MRVRNPEHHHFIVNLGGGRDYWRVGPSSAGREAEAVSAARPSSDGAGRAAIPFG